MVEKQKLFKSSHYLVSGHPNMEEIEITEKGKGLVKDWQFMKYNKINILSGLLQTETHIKNLVTLGEGFFKKGHGACIAKHLLEIRGELLEVQAHLSSQLKSGITLDELDELPVFEKVYIEVDCFLKEIQEKHNYHKRDLLNLVRGWRKEIEETTPAFTSFNCKCLHSIPYFKQLGLIGFGALIGAIVSWLV